MVAIGQIFPRSLQMYNFFLKCFEGFILFVLHLHNTYQERLRDGPYEVLATLKMQVPNPTQKGGR